MIPLPIIQRFIKRGWWLILLPLLLSALVAFLLAQRQPRTYQTSASYIVIPSPTEAQNDFGDVVYGLDTLSQRATVATYSEIFGSANVLDTTIDLLDIPVAEREEYEYDVVVLPETSIIRIIATGPHPGVLPQFVDTLGDQATAFIEELYSVYQVIDLDQAKTPLRPHSPVPLRNAAIAGIAGALLGVVLAILRTPEVITGERQTIVNERARNGSVENSAMAIESENGSGIRPQPTHDR